MAQRARGKRRWLAAGLLLGAGIELATRPATRRRIAESASIVRRRATETAGDLRAKWTETTVEVLERWTETTEEGLGRALLTAAERRDASLDPLDDEDERPEH